VTEILAKLGKRRRAWTWALAAVALVAAAGGAWALRRALSGGEAARAPDAGVIAMAPPDAEPTVIGPPIDAGVAPVDARPVRDAREIPDAKIRGSGAHSGDWGTGTGRTRVDAGEPVDAASAVTVRVRVSPADSEVKIGDGGWKKLGPDGLGDISVPPGGVLVAVRNDACCEATEKRIMPNPDGETVAIALGLLPAQLVPLCDVPDVKVRLDGRTGRLGAVNLIPFGETTQTNKTVDVEFTGKTIDLQKVSVRYNEKVEVVCKLE
jgi:hypothetical protein